MTTPFYRTAMLIYAFAASTVLLTACTDRGAVVADQVTKQFTSDTTAADVWRTLGSPTYKMFTKDKQTVLGYVRHCSADASDEICAKAPADEKWQYCEFWFTAEGKYSGTSCSWLAKAPPNPT